MISGVSKYPFTHLSAAERVERLAEIKASLRSLVMEDVSLHSQVEHIESSLVEAMLPDGKDLVALYAAMGVVLPEVVGKTFEQIKAFHASITANRKIHLADGLAKLRVRREQVAAEIERLETESARLIDM
ncbi:hypothetical protein G6L37_34725 [Agrobacterium rubi]|nr:hypothetical protein [Agrobacterium rubi]NTF23723.1 hypothetical protein [Agrobacterium rubi]